MKPLKLTPAELELMKKGFSASLAGQKPEYAVEQYLPKLQARAEANAKALAEGEKQKSGDFLAKAAQEPGAVKTPSRPRLQDASARAPARARSRRTSCRCNYRGTLIDGTEFDASAKHGGPATFQLNGVIPCWTEAVSRMKVGEKARMRLPRRRSPTATAGRRAGRSRRARRSCSRSSCSASTRRRRRRRPAARR